MPAQKTPKDPTSSSHVLPIATEYDRLTHTRGWVLLATQILITSVTLINRMIHMAEFDTNEQKLGKHVFKICFTNVTTTNNGSNEINMGKPDNKPSPVTVYEIG